MRQFADRTHRLGTINEAPRKPKPKAISFAMSMMDEQYSDSHIDTDEDMDEHNDTDVDSMPKPRWSNRNSSLRREHVWERSSMNILDEDDWGIDKLTDTVFREKIIDFVEDLGVHTLQELHRAMKITNPKSRLRADKIFKELQEIRPDLDDPTRAPTQIDVHEESKEDFGLEPDDDQEELVESMQELQELQMCVCVMDVCTVALMSQE